MTVPAQAQFTSIHREHEERCLLFCQKCLLFYLLPRPSPEELSAYYMGEFLKNIERGMRDLRITEEEKKRRETQRFERLFQSIRKRLPDTIGSVLDVGGGSGLSLVPFRDRGIEVALVDPTSPPEKSATRVYESLHAIQHSSFQPSVILSLHTLEHIGAVGETLEKLAGISRPGTHWVFEVPADILFLEKASWGRFKSLTHPEHINLFFPDSLKRLTERQGLRVLECEPVVTDYFTGPILSFRLIGVFEGAKRPCGIPYPVPYLWSRLLYWRVRGSIAFRTHAWQEAL